MRVAILHYHLRPGGVTRVIQSAVSALAERQIQTVVLAGEAPSSTMPIPNYACIEELSYSQRVSSGRAQDVVAALTELASQKLGGAPDLWHIHNHALGKNALLPEVVQHLASQGQRLLLQFHDFAEDGRPENYKFLRRAFQPSSLGTMLYPQASHIHYGVINQRDLEFLHASGVPRARLHYLPNAVRVEEPDNVAPDHLDAERVFLYPVRAIRRKNLGEFLLWAALAESGDLFAVARSPQNPQARPIYENWVAFAQTLNLPVKFGVGEQWNGAFSSLLMAAYALVTTSVTEGFGLSFLEPWLVMRPLAGRDLPEITGSLQTAGLNLSALYQRLEVPLSWIGAERFRQEVKYRLKEAYQAYGQTVQPAEIERAFSAAVHQERVDFGRLNETFQQEIIRQVAQSQTAQTELSPSSLITDDSTRQATLRQNHALVREQFHEEQYGSRLLQTYQQIVASPASPVKGLNADTVLRQFLAPERFYLLRT